MNYYEHHLGDYAAATGHLSWDEDMAYTRLLRAYYHHEKGIPQDQAYRLARASTSGQKKAVDAVLAEFFTIADGSYHQKRADEEIERFHDKQRKAKASAEARWAHTERNANAMRTHSEGNAPRHQTPDTIPKEKKKPSASRTRRCPEAFTVPGNVWMGMAGECPGLDLERETAKFRDWEFKTPKSDWLAAWRTWMRKAFDDLKTRAPPQSFRERDEAAAAARFAEFTGRKVDVLDNVIEMEVSHARLGNS